MTDAELTAGVINPSYFLGGELVLDPELARDKHYQARRLDWGLSEGNRNRDHPARQRQDGERAQARLRPSRVRPAGLRDRRVRRRRTDARRCLGRRTPGEGGGDPAASRSLLGLGHAGDAAKGRPLRTRVLRTAEVRRGEIEVVFRELQAEALRRFGVDGGVDIRFAFSADMRYVGQEHTARVELSSAALPVETIEQAFHAALSARLHLRSTGGGD